MREKGSDKKEDSFIIIAIIFLVFMVIGVYFVVLHPILKNVKSIEDQRIEEKIYLYNIYTTSESDRHFTLGCGRLDGREYYVAYTKLEDGGYQLKKIDAENTIVYQTLEEKEEAYVIYNKNGYEQILDTKLYVPKNTIIQEYNLTP